MDNMVFLIHIQETSDNTDVHTVQTQADEKKEKEMDKRKRKSEMDKERYMLKKDDLRLQYRLVADFCQKTKNLSRQQNNTRSE